jgi:hypothetical protein
MKRVEEYNKLLYGLILGILVPAITFFITWKITYDGSIIDYFRSFRQMERLAGLVSLSTIPDLLLFFIFIWLNMYRSARGVIFATFILAFLMLILKFS